jgi:hypothetical protein
MITFLVLEVIIAVVDKMKNSNLGGFLGGLVGIAVSIYVIGYAWRASQSRKNISTTGLLPSVDRPFIDNMPRVNEGMTLEQLKQQDLQLQALLDAQRNKNSQPNVMNAAGFFDGAFN